MRNEDAYNAFENVEETDVWAELSDFADQVNRYKAVRPRVTEGDIRCVKRRQPEAYWENRPQISRAADTATVEEFLGQEDDMSLTLKKKMWIILAVLLVVFAIVGRM